MHIGWASVSEGPFPCHLFLPPLACASDEERAVLKQRERDMAEAEEARRKRVTVSFDLLGALPDAASSCCWLLAPSGCCCAAIRVLLPALLPARVPPMASACSALCLLPTVVPRPLPAGRKVVLEEGQVPGGPEEAAAVEAQLEAARAAAAARTAAAATAAEAAQGGDAAAPTALAAVEDKLRDLRITVNPSMAARHFVFLPQQAQQQQGQQREQHAAAHRQRPAAGGGHAAGDGQPQGRHGGSSSEGAQQQQQGKQGRGHSRLQHDGALGREVRWFAPALGPGTMPSSGSLRVTCCPPPPGPLLLQTPLTIGCPLMMAASMSWQQSWRSRWLGPDRSTLPARCAPLLM